MDILGAQHDLETIPSNRPIGRGAAGAHRSLTCRSPQEVEHTMDQFLMVSAGAAGERPNGRQRGDNVGGELGLEERFDRLVCGLSNLRHPVVEAQENIRNGPALATRRETRYRGLAHVAISVRGRDRHHGPPVRRAFEPSELRKVPTRPSILTVVGQPIAQGDVDRR